jgi:molybdopterin molybdotransferase
VSKIATRRLLDDCFLHDKDRLRHDEALALLESRLVRVVEPETVKLERATGRVLAEPVKAPRDIPAFDNAAVDGYGLAHGSLDKTGETWLELSHRIPAGLSGPKPLAAGKAVRIFTGAVMPAGADSVVMQEDCRTEPRNGRDGVLIPEGVKRGINVRRAGEDQARNAVIADAGTSLRPFDIAAIASAGFDRLVCYRPLKVALISTGDEIKRPGRKLKPGEVYDSNHFLLHSLLATPLVETSDLGVLPDETEQVRTCLTDAAISHDLIISTGGASRGEEDHIVAALNELGRLHAWQLAIKPGRPLAFGQIDDTVFLGLPGNPVAVAVCFLLYARPVIAVLAGAPWPEPQRYKVKSGFEMRKKPLRREFLRGWLEQDAARGLVARQFDRHGSGLISSLVAAGGLIEIAEDVTEIAIGDDIDFIPFGELGVGQM